MHTQTQVACTASPASPRRPLVLDRLARAVMLVWWPIEALRGHLQWRRVRREAEARRRDYDAAGWV